MRIVDEAVEVLVKKGRIKGETLALDSTFIKPTAAETLTTELATVTLNQELDEPSKLKTSDTGFI